MNNSSISNGVSYQSNSALSSERLMLDVNVTSAIKLWYSHAIHPGDFTMALLEGRYGDALDKAHELLKPYFDDHVIYVESLPLDGRGVNVDNFKGGIFLELSLK